MLIKCIMSRFQIKHYLIDFPSLRRNLGDNLRRDDAVASPLAPFAAVDLRTRGGDSCGLDRIRLPPILLKKLPSTLGDLRLGLHSLSLSLAIASSIDSPRLADEKEGQVFFVQTSATGSTTSSITCSLGLLESSKGGSGMISFLLHSPLLLLSIKLIVLALVQTGLSIKYSIFLIGWALLMNSWTSQSSMLRH